MRCKFSIREKMRDRVDRKVLKLFGHVRRISEKQMTQRLYEYEVEHRRAGGGSCVRWLDEVRRRGMRGCWSLEVPSHK